MRLRAWDKQEKRWNRRFGINQKGYFLDGIPFEDMTLGIDYYKQVGFANHIMIVQLGTGVYDANNREIFEGDVVQVDYGVPMVVKFGLRPLFNTLGFFLERAHITTEERVNTEGHGPFPPAKGEVRVIGNMFEGFVAHSDDEL